MQEEKISQDKQTTVSTSSAVDLGKEFAPFSPDFAANLYSFYARARQEEGVFFSPFLNLWVVSHFKDAITILKDHRRFCIFDENPRSETYAPEVFALLGQSPLHCTPTLLTVDPPVHTRLRGCMNKAMSPQRIATLEPRIRNIANQLIDQFEGLGQVDFATQFARPYAVRATTTLMDVPEADLRHIPRWSEDMMALFYGDPLAEQQLVLARSLLEMHQYFYHLAEQSQMAPQDDLAGHLFKAGNAEEVPLSIAEVGNILLEVLGAGFETTTGLLSNCLYHMLAEPIHWQAILDNPADIPALIEETLRLDLPVHGPLRRTAETVELGGKTIPKGALLQVMLDSSNHDETIFSEPETFDPHRKKLSRHIGFGYGAHYCVGSPLARLEVRILLEQLRERLPSLRLVPQQEFAYTPSLIFHRLMHLLVEWDRPAI